MVLRDKLVRRAISLMSNLSRRRIRRIFAYITMVITFILSCLLNKQNTGFTWSILVEHLSHLMVNFIRVATDTPIDWAQPHPNTLPSLPSPYGELIIESSCHPGKCLRLKPLA